jgi:excinuclease ABC subunit B
MNEAELAREIRRVEKEMLEHARNLEFEQAAATRDRLRELKERAFGVSSGEIPAQKPAAVPTGKTPRRAGGRRSAR